VARQYTGTAGKVTNAQVAVSLHLATDEASCPVNWRLFVPEQWDPDSDRAPDDVHARRERAGIPDTARHREKWRLALDMLDEAIGWGLTPPLIAADAGYGDAAEFRQGLQDRGLQYMVQVASTASAHPQTAERAVLPRQGQGRPSLPKYRDKASTVKELAVAVGQDKALSIVWRYGSKHRGGQVLPMRSHFLLLRVRPASRVHRRAHAGEDLPVCWLIVEWPPEEPEPARYWLSNLPATTPRTRLARLAKLRWRVEHDYRELKDGLGLDHYEGRTWQGWHHHVTLVSAAHAFCTLQRLNPKAHAPA
jgi:SRSO17 transposase